MEGVPVNMEPVDNDWLSDDEDCDVCKICRCPGDDEQPLYYPCLCKGSIKFIHRDCLMSWVEHSGKQSCELCNHQYSFKLVYQEDAPAVLPKVELFQHAARKAISWAASSFHELYAMFIWLIVFPVLTSWIWRFFFCRERTVYSVLPLFKLEFTWGAFLAVGISSTCIAAFSIFEYFSKHLNNGEWLDDGEEAGAIEAFDDDGPDAAAADPAAEEAPDEELLEDEAGFEELTGWNGPYHELVLKMLKMVSFNALVLFVFVLVPMSLGILAMELFLTMMRSHVMPPELVSAPPTEWLLSWANASATGPTLPTQSHEDFYLSFLEFVFGGTIDMSIPFHAAVGYGIILSMALGWLLATFLFGVLARGVGESPHTIHDTITSTLTQAMWTFYTSVKVAVLLVVELGLFPLMSGWWLDAEGDVAVNRFRSCSLTLFDSTLENRVQFFRENPVTSTVLHWMVGMLYQYHFANVVGWTLETVRPQVLWFLRAPTDPDFQPIKEMVVHSVPRHIRRIALSALLYSSIISLTVWAPIALCFQLAPSVFPFHVWFRKPIYDGPIGLVVHIAAPLTLEHIRPNTTFKWLLLQWLLRIGAALGLERYLFHRYDDRTGVELPAEKPPRFLPRIVSLYLMGWLSVFLFNIALVALPVLAGRWFFRLISFPHVNDIYTFGVGFYLLWDSARAVKAAIRYASRNNVLHMMKVALVGTLLSLKLGLLLFFWIGLIPVLIGVLFELSILTPLRVPADQTPLRSPMYQNWAVGLVYLKLWFKIVTLSPSSQWKPIFDKIRRDGLAEVDMLFVLSNVIVPFVYSLLLFLSVPYILARGVIPLVSSSTLAASRASHVVYTMFVLAFCWLAVMRALRDALVEWHNSVRDEKYLIGRDIVNVGVDVDEPEQIVGEGLDEGREGSGRSAGSWGEEEGMRMWDSEDSQTDFDEPMVEARE